MSSIALNLTDAIVRNATEGVKRSFIRDIRETGLVLQITPNGHKSFYLHKKYKGESRRILLGEASILSVKHAREEAKKAKALLVKGIDPMDAKRAARAEYTMQELFDEYIKDKDNLSIKTISDYIAEWKNKLQGIFGRKKISSISFEELQDFHKKYSKTAPYAANRCIGLVKAMFNYAIIHGFYHNSNPTNLVKMNPEEPRIRSLQQDEMKRFFIALKDFKNINCHDIVSILLFTGARKMNVLSMRWEDLDIDGKIWKIPKTKTDKNVTLPLSESVIDILKRRLANKTDNNPWVFPANSISGHITDIKKSWAILLKKANIKGIRLHDLRHTLATRLIADGATTFVVQRALAHKSIQSTQIYVNLGVEDIRSPINFTVQKMQSL